MKKIKHIEVQITFADESICYLKVNPNYSNQIQETNYFFIVVEDDVKHRFPLKDIFKINESIIFEDEK